MNSRCPISAVMAAKSSYEQFAEARSKLFYEVKADYYDLYFNKRAIEISSLRIDLLMNLKNLATIRYESGVVSAVDELRVEMEIGELENQLALLKDQRDILVIGFNNVLDRSSDHQVSLPGILGEPDFPLSREAALDSVNRFNHSLLAVDFTRESMGYREELSRLQGNPSFTVGIDYSVIERGDNNMPGKDALMLPVIGVSLPLNRNKYRSIVKEAAFLSEAKTDEMKEKENIIETVFEKVWKEYNDSGRRIALYKSQLELAEKSSLLLETAYSSGRVDFTDLISMERKVLMYSLELEKARSDRYTAIAFINYLMGQ